MITRRPDLDIEVWRPEKEISAIREGEIFGLKTFLFPVHRVMIGKSVSFPMIRRLKSLCEENDVYVFIHSIYSPFSIIGPLLLPKAKIIVLHHGGLPPKMRKNNLKNNLKDSALRYSYKKIHHITYQNAITKDYLNTFVDRFRTSFWVVGADYSKFTPLSNRSELRKTYGLEKETVYGIYVGPYSNIKNVELILEAYQELKNKYNFSLIFVGGKKTDPLHEDIQRLGLTDFGRVPWKQLNEIYNCADFYIHPIFNFKREAFGVTPVEAMAADLPVASSLLPFLQKELPVQVEALGKSVYQKEEVCHAMEYLIQNHDSFNSVRENSQLFLDADTFLTDHLINLTEDE